VYKYEFVPMGNPSTWPPYQGKKFVANIRLRRMGKRHPKITRYLNGMDRQVHGPRKYSLCGGLMRCFRKP
ncbi:hypothetical protein PIB30_099733, partial [Stylosanthes scabra]|nr:hypothetical protein [Stylosanthes scabra]